MMSAQAKKVFELLENGKAIPSDDRSQILDKETREVLANKIDLPNGDSVYQATGEVHTMKAGCKIIGCHEWSINDQWDAKICLWFEWDCSGKEK